MTKYKPLQLYLQIQPSERTHISLTFEKIEEIINDRLPLSAYQYSAWWGNEIDGKHVSAHSWIDAGWKVETLDLTHKIVYFVREK